MKRIAALVALSWMAAGADVYLDLIEKAVGAYDDAHLEEYTREAETAGVQEHGFPRLAACMAELAAEGRLKGRKELLARMMSASCASARRGRMPPKSGGNEFSVKELVGAVARLEQASLYPKATTDAWRADLAAVDARRCYTCVPKLGSGAHNWAVFGAASEQARIASGMGGDAEFVDRYVCDQLQWFDDNGMYRDPHEPAVYDFVTRLQFAQILACGYAGKGRARLEELMDRSAAPTLMMQSVCGEIPYGGRSNQFLHNNLFYAALCEWYAARFARRGDPATAGRFRRAALDAAAAVRPWLDATPVRHVKNFHRRPEDVRYGTGRCFGCERYAYFDKYMITMGTWAAMARSFADAAVAPAARSLPAGGGKWSTSDHFHWNFIWNDDYTVQEDYRANPEYDATGIGRIHRRGAPAAICLSTPFAAKPNYMIGTEDNCNPGPLAIAPVGGRMEYRLVDGGVEIAVAGDGDVALTLPVYEFDGERETVVKVEGECATVDYLGWRCMYTVSGGRFVDTGTKYFNRNGRYRRIDARGAARVVVKVSIAETMRRGGLSLVYDAGRPQICRGDVMLPRNVSPTTPAALLIHGGGWCAMDKKDVVGIGDFLVSLGYVVYNVNYRLAGRENPWPACGDDCVKAGEFMFSNDFAAKTGVRPKSILVIGGSAGGHLALWTGLKLGAKCDRIVSISGIADPEVDYPSHPGMYRGLFGANEVTRELRDTMSVMKLIRPNGPKILLTHATQDKVVPIATAKSFLAAYRASGNDVGLFEYPSYLQPGLTGHCIWIPGSNPHRLIPRLEREIAYFLTPTPVPTPRPVKSDYEISAHYYAGTEHMAEWDMVRQTIPERKPLLGWFDETDPENVDWQVKWATEHGISAYCCCWYWNQGAQRLDHWVQAYYRSQHHRHLKWYMMYANHNQPGAHSTADQIAVSRFWIDNYFKTPEYYTIDGKPVVVYCSANNLDRDFINEAASRGEKLASGEGMRRAMAITERMAKEAGLKGVHWIYLDWLGHKAAWEFSPDIAAWVKRGGFAERMTYHFGNIGCGMCPDACGPRDFPLRFDFNVTCAASVRLAEHADADKDLPFWPSLPTGYDDSPRKFQDARRVVNRTPGKFRACCEKIKAICDAKGVKRLIVAPISEWQEGSMVEPNEDYGFAHYDVIRDVFCRKPVDGWPKNLTPKDVGRPSLEYPPTYLAERPVWNFDKSQEGWYRNPFGTYKANWDERGWLSFRAVGGIIAKRAGMDCWQHNVRARCRPFRADDYLAARVRMRIRPNPDAPPPKNLESRMRLYWGTKERPLIGPHLTVDYSEGFAGQKVVMDGEWREYTLDLRHDVLWTGEVDELWLQATELPQSLVDIDYIRFE